MMQEGLILEPTAFGAELLAWAENLKDCTTGSFLSESVTLEEPALEIPKGIKPRTSVRRI